MSKETITAFEAPKVRGELRKINNPDVELKDMMANTETYMPRIGERYTFPESNQFYAYKPTGFTAEMLLMAAYVSRNGSESKPTWLNITPLKRVDIDRNPVYPAFAECANAVAVADKLRELGSLTPNGEKTIVTPVYEGRTRKYETVEVEGVLISKPITRETSCVTFAEVQ